MVVVVSATSHMVVGMIYELNMKPTPSPVYLWVLGAFIQAMPVVNINQFKAVLQNTETFACIIWVLNVSINDEILT